MGVQPEGVEGASGKPPPRLRRGETLCNIKGTTAQFVGSAGDAFSAICFLQKSRFTSSKHSISAIASDKKCICHRTNSFVRYCPKLKFGEENQSEYHSTNVSVLTLKTPLVVSRSAGITGRLANESVMNGSMPRFTPCAHAAALQCSNFSFTSGSGRSVNSPATSSGKRACICPFSTTMMPPCIFFSSLTAKAMSSGDTPQAMMLWLSWAIDVATAPR